MFNQNYSEQVHPILEEIDTYYKRFGEEPARFQTKAIGAVTNEIIRQRLEGEGISVSTRNVFIDGFTTEWDLIVHKVGAVPEIGCLWSPADVLAVIEIKYSGLYDHLAVKRLNCAFSKLIEKHPHIKPFYFTLMETTSAREKITDETLGCKAFTLHWHRQRKREYVYNITNDWDLLVKSLLNL